MGDTILNTSFLLLLFFLFFFICDRGRGVKIRNRGRKKRITVISWDAPAIKRDTTPSKWLRNSSRQRMPRSSKGRCINDSKTNIPSVSSFQFEENAIMRYLPVKTSGDSTILRHESLTSDVSRTFLRVENFYPLRKLWMGSIRVCGRMEGRRLKDGGP